MGRGKALDTLTTAPLCHLPPPQRTFLLNSLDNIIIQASYIIVLVGVILYGQQK